MPEEILYIYTQVADGPKRPMSRAIFEGDRRYRKLTGKGGGWVQTRKRSYPATFREEREDDETK